MGISSLGVRGAFGSHTIQEDNGSEVGKDGGDSPPQPSSVDAQMLSTGENDEGGKEGMIMRKGGRWGKKKRERKKEKSETGSVH